MKRFALSVLLLVLAACAGTYAREHALEPALQTAWPSIRAQVEREALASDVSTPNESDARRQQIQQTLNEFDLALGFRFDFATGTREVRSGVNASALAALNWRWVDESVENDIVRRLASDEIGPGVATSLRERMSRFVEARALFTSRR